MFALHYDYHYDDDSTYTYDHHNDYDYDYHNDDDCHYEHDHAYYSSYTYDYESDYKDDNVEHYRYVLGKCLTRTGPHNLHTSTAYMQCELLAIHAEAWMAQA